MALFWWLRRPLELLGPPAGEDVAGSVDQRLRELDRDDPGLFRQVERRALLEPRQSRPRRRERASPRGSR